MPSRYPSPSPRAVAADAVYRYLTTPRGKATPLHVKARLLVLDWPSVGACEPPTLDQVHWTRMWFEEMALADAREHLETVRRALRHVAVDNDVERPHEGL